MTGLKLGSSLPSSPVIPGPLILNHFPDLYALAFFQLGMLDATDNPTVAAENFEKFLTLWGDQGSSRPEVQLARKWLAHRS